MVLAMAAPFASLGVSLGCFIRNLIFRPEMFSAMGPDGGAIRLPGTGIIDVVLSLIAALLAIIWVVAFVRFVRNEPRSLLTIALAVLAGAAFIWSAWQNWLLAYPVCNAF